MGAGSAKGVSTANDDDDPDIDNDRFSVASHDSPKPPKSVNTSQNNNADARSTNIRAKMEALSAESEDDDTGTKSAADDGEKKEDDKKRGLFGFSKKEEDKKTNAFVHDEDKDQKDGKKSSTSSRGFRFFKFKKEDKKKSEEKDEKLDQEIKDLQRTFDSLGIVGKSVWDDPKKNPGKPKKSQSADDIRDLEPMRNRMNQKRRLSRPNNGTSFRRGTDGLQTSSGGSRRTFKYSWETENMIAAPVKTEDWKYEAVTIEGFDLDKFKRANIEGSSLNSRIPNSVGSDSPPVSPQNGIKSPPLTYDPLEQRLLATIERDY